MSRTYRAEILTDKAADAPAAVVTYSFSRFFPATWNGPEEGGELEIESIVPASYELTDADERQLRCHAELEDLREARS